MSWLLQTQNITAPPTSWAPATGQRIITVRLGSASSIIPTGLDGALARYNNLNLKIAFQRVTSGGNIRSVAPTWARLAVVVSWDRLPVSHSEW